MFSRLRNPYAVAFVPFIRDNYDITTKGLGKPPPVDGWDRLSRLLEPSEYSSVSPQLVNVLNTTLFGFFMGSFCGGVVQSRQAYQNFMDSNMATQFRNQYEAKRRVQDAVTIGFYKGALKWGFRIAYFTGMYTLLHTVIGVYRGKSSLLEYISAGVITGALYKLSLGIRGMIAGGIVGGCLTFITGSITLLLLKISGNTIENYNAWLYSAHEVRVHKYKEIMQDANQKEKDLFRNKTMSDIKYIDDPETDKTENDDKKEQNELVK